MRVCPGDGVSGDKVNEGNDSCFTCTQNLIVSKQIVLVH